MFEDSTFASTPRRNPRRGWAAVFSFVLQAVVLSIFVLIPLLYTDALPLNSLKNYVEIPPPPGPPAPAQQPIHQVSQRPITEIRENVLVQPHTIPPRIAHIVDPPDTGPVGDGIGVVGMPPGVGSGSPIMRDILAPTANNSQVKPSLSVPHVIRLTGGVTEGLLIHKVTPIYPQMARQLHVQGSVVLQATIGRDGTIENLHVLSGHPLLVQSAIDAVRQWRYRPYLLSNEPVDVETQITVNFTLGG